MLNKKKGLLISLSTALILFSSFAEAGETNNNTPSTSTPNEQHFGFNHEDIPTNFLDLICQRVYSNQLPTLSTTSYIQTFNLYSTLKKLCDTMVSQVKRTGQTISYYPNDDGDYQKGRTPQYERDNENEIVTDHVTKLQWQDNEAVKTDLVEGYFSSLNDPSLDDYDNLVNFIDTVGVDALDSKHYCTYLNLGGHHDWRLPKFRELLDIVDFGHSSPSINPIFENTALNSYWTSSGYGHNSDYRWGINFTSGIQDINRLANHKTYIRCVREGE